MNDTITQSSWIAEREFIRWMMSNPGKVTASEAWVIAVILTRINCNTGIAFPGRERIGKDANVGSCTVDSAIRMAKDLRLLTITRRGGRTNEYKAGPTLVQFHTKDMVVVEEAVETIDEHFIPDIFDDQCTAGGSGGDSERDSIENDTPDSIDSSESLFHENHGSNGIRDNGQRERIEQDQQQEQEQENNPFANNLKSVVPKQIPWQKIIGLFNQMAKELGMSQIKAMSPQRKASIRARINQHGMENFLTVLIAPTESRLLQGKAKTNNEKFKDWKATFDWMMGPENFVHILEGKYQDKKKSAGGDHHAY